MNLSLYPAPRTPAKQGLALFLPPVPVLERVSPPSTPPELEQAPITGPAPELGPSGQLALEGILSPATTVITEAAPATEHDCSWAVTTKPAEGREA